MEYESIVLSMYVCDILCLHSVTAELYQREPPPPTVRHAVYCLLQMLVA